MLHFGYCTNVHPGKNLIEVQTRLTEVSLPLKERLSPQEPFPIGIWLNENVTAELADPKRLKDFCSWLSTRGLVPYTLNGFPQGDFHREVVKLAVYQPTWAETSRLSYTCRLAEIQAILLEGQQSRGTISTLPLGWRETNDSTSFEAQCCKNLFAFAKFAAELESRSGFHVRLAIEAEPGCYLATNAELCAFFDRFLERHSNGEGELVRRYIGVCHDICHAAVQFEDQIEAFTAFQQREIAVCKVQVSAALVANFDDPQVNPEEMADVLKQFAEPRYMHQTRIDGVDFYDDLPHALAQHKLRGEWRVHFHVPIYAVSFAGGLTTTHQEILHCLNHFSTSSNWVDWEIETYAWNVIPPDLRPACLIDGIEQEYHWLLANSQKTPHAFPLMGTADHS